MEERNPGWPEHVLSESTCTLGSEEMHWENNFLACQLALFHIQL
jgi:hypothetical protein